MNIFITHKNHQQSASNLDDLRLGCQIKELAQILSTAIFNKVGMQSDLYKPYNRNGRFAKWAGSSKYCMTKLIDYGRELETEYEYRFDKPHKSYCIILNSYKYIEEFNEVGCEDYLSYVGDEQLIQYMLSGLDIYQAYQKVLQEKWYKDIKIPKWTKRNKPKFYKGNRNDAINQK